MCVYVCVYVFRELLSTWDLLYKCDTIKQAITIAITTKRFDMYTNKLSSAYRVGGGKSQESKRERESVIERECVCVCVWKRERAKERTKAKATSVHCQRAWWRFRFASLRYARVALFHCVWQLCACACVSVCFCMCVCWSSSLLLLFILIYSLLCSYWCCSCGCCCC